MSKESEVQVCLNVGMSSLAREMAYQIRDGLTTDDILKFIKELDQWIGDSEFTYDLFHLAETLYRETLT